MSAGADFVAVIRLTNKAGEVLAMPGETCERVPEVSLAWNEAKGRIRRADKTVRVSKRREQE
jgi:hypothetical protein